MFTEIRTLTACKLRKLMRMKICHESYRIPGIAVGNGLTDPITILDYSHFVYQLGLVDTNTYNEMKSVEDTCRTAMSEGRLVDAFTVHTTTHYLNCVLSAFRLFMSVRFLSLQNHGYGWSLGKP
jgi:hypothetical protein